MLWANHLGKRANPTLKTEAHCLFCKREVIPVHDDNFVNHWEHKYDTACDPWNEKETIWHRKWKLSFPNDWQEVMIVKDREKHIADIQTPAGIVINFCTQPYAKDEIVYRDKYWEKAIWIIDFSNESYSLEPLQAIKIYELEIESEKKISKLKGDDKHEALEKLERKKKRIKKSYEGNYILKCADVWYPWFNIRNAVFFDIGNDEMFMKINDGTAISKVSKEGFIRTFFE